MRNYGNFFVFNHQQKADVLIQALTARGWEQTRRTSEAYFVLSDVDVQPYAKRIEEYRRNGTPVFLYPHAARPSLFHDFDGLAPSKYISASFVTSQGHVEILETIHKQHRFEIIGWFLCPIKPYRPRADFRRVIFAPIHPNADDSLSQIDRRINCDTFKKLIQLVQAGHIELTVRYIRGLEKNGLWIEDGITYNQVEPRVSLAEIDQADLVISHQTYAYLAVARGVPTIMMGESEIPRIVGTLTRGELRHVRSWEKYKHLLMYPLDILAEEDTLGLFKRAIASDEEIMDWRRRLVGEPFDENRFVNAVESYL